MSEEKDALDDLLSFSRRPRRKKPAPSLVPAGGDSPDDGEEAGGGLNPLELLELPREQRKVINWLSRKRQASLDEIQDALGDDEADLQSILRSLKEADYVHEALIEGEVYYRVVYRGRLKRMARGLPNHIWARIDMDKVIFLQQVPLFKGLPEELLKVFAEKLESRRYNRNEIILWQGDQNQNLYLIKNGIVGITRLSSRTQDVNILAYLNEGEIFGEFSLFAEPNYTATATVTALSEVNVFTIKHEEFATLLREHQNTAIEITRILMQRLHEMRDRATAIQKSVNLSLVICVGEETGVERVLSSGLATAATQQSDKGAVYSEHPSHFQLPRAFGFERRAKLSRQPGGYDVFVPRSMPTLSAKARVTMVLEQLSEDYDAIIIGVPARIEDSINVLLERANQFVMVAPIGEWEELERFYNLLEKTVHLPSKHVVKVAIGDASAAPEGADIVLAAPADVKEAWRGDWDGLPPAYQTLASDLANRLRRQNEMSIYIPQSLTSLDNQAIDTAEQVSATMSLMESLFGDVQEMQVKESWDGEHGLRDETVTVIRSRITDKGMREHLQTVLRHAEKMKEELQQEVLAIDINHRLVLV